MAEPGSIPSTNLPTTPSPPTHPTLPGVPRIRFPDQFLTATAHGESSASSKSSPVFVTSMKQALKDTTELGDLRRPISKEVVPVFPETSISKRMSLRSADAQRRSKRFRQGKGLSALKDPFLAEFEPSAFSDEYDLSHEDPKIVQDVERALELQSRRRDRRSFTPSQSSVAGYQTLVNNTRSFHLSSPVPGSPSSFVQRSRVLPDIDFSPSVQVAPLHPIPISSNGGATLDWTGSQSEDEKQRPWMLGKRKGKERALPSNSTISEKQEALFADRIARIRSEANPLTFRKAAIVSDQLGRRYNIVYNSISNEHPINLAKAVRWYAESESSTQAWLDSAEPLTWLKHLIDRRGGKRSRWHLSALIVEEYVKSNRIDSSLSIIRDDSSSAQRGLFPSNVSLTDPSYHLHPTGSDPSLRLPSGNLLRRIRSSDDHVSFGPRINSAGSSMDGDYKGNVDTNRKWPPNLSVLVDSARRIPSISSYPRQNSPVEHSPTSPFPGIVKRVRRGQMESDDGSSSVINSQSEDYNQSGRRRKRGGQRYPRALPSALQSPRESGTEMNAPGETSDTHDVTPAPVEDALASHPASKPDVEPHLNPESEISATVPQVTSRHRVIHRTSFPVTGIAERERHDETKEEELEYEYEIKSQMLDNIKAQNHRLRQKSQRIASEVREYDLLQARLAQTHGTPYRGLPQELLDALSHDPSSVTGGIRGQTGWKAVEGIYARILRQREVFQVYLSSVDDITSVPDSLLDQPISLLMGLLGEVGHEMEALAHKELETVNALAKVKSLHAQVRSEYNNALSHTSAIYPELSQIIALEESYKDQYQQVWEFGMDALTFILDNIAPFWRNYGKTIGDDINDFLIIPWYRNEFTGEPKRYEISSFPRRSARHWFALSCLFWFSVGITFLQIRAAIFCTFIYKLSWIDNSGFRWLIMPSIWSSFVILWLAVFFEICIVILQLRVIAWWLGWLVGLVS